MINKETVIGEGLNNLDVYPLQFGKSFNLNTWCGNCIPFRILEKGLLENILWRHIKAD